MKDLMDGHGAETVLEMSGIPAAFSEGIDVLQLGGRYLIVSQAHQHDVPSNPSVIMHKQARLIGSRSAGSGCLRGECQPQWARGGAWRAHRR